MTTAFHVRIDAERVANTRSPASACCVFLVLILASIVTPPRAGAEGPWKVRVPVQIGPAVPVGESLRRLSPLGLTFTFGALASVKPVPLWFGGEIGGALMLADTHSRRLEDFPTITAVTCTKPRVLLAHLVLRLQSPWGRVQPYVEGRFGFKRFSSETSVSLKGNRGEVSIDETFEPRATARSFGITLGTEMRMESRQAAEDSAKKADGAWSISVHYLRGPSTTFSSITVVDPRAERSPTEVRFRSRTDILLIMLGVSFDAL